MIETNEIRNGLLRVPERPGDGRRVSIETFSTMIAVSFGILCVFSRIGLEGKNIALVLNSLSISFFILFLPSILVPFLSPGNEKRERIWYLSYSFISIIGLAVAMFGGLCAQTAGVRVLPVYIVLGLGIFVAVLIRGIRNGDAVKSGVTLFFLFFSLWLVCLYWGFEYYSPLFREKIISGAYAHRDTLFHGDISSMIGTYGIPSTALDGLARLHYHTFSHRIYAPLSYLMGVDTITFYNMGLPILMVPLFFFSFLLFVREVDNFLGTHLPDHVSIDESNIRYWLLFGILFIHMIPYPIRYRFHHVGPNYSYILSPSYMMALTLTFLSLGVVFARINRGRDRASESKGDCLLFILFLPAMYLVVSMTKLSFAYLTGLLYLFLFFRLRLYKNRIHILSATAFFLAACILYWTEIRHMLTGEYYGVGQNVQWPLLRFFDYLFDSAAALFYIGVRIWIIRIRSVRDLREILRNRSALDVEILSFLVFVSFFPNYPYFQDFQNFMAYALILANFSNLYPLLFRRGEGCGEQAVSS